MIFNKELDESLRLILGSDLKRRDMIIDFIVSIPDDLFEQIYVQLDKYNEYEKNEIDIFDREDYCLRGEYEDLNNNIKYNFIIDMFDSSLTISKYIKSSLNTFLDVDSGYSKVFEITLDTNNKCNNLDIYGQQDLGKVEDKVRNIEVNYKLVRTIIGNRLLISDDFGVRKYQKYNQSNFVDELYLKNLYKVKNNVRVRKLR